MNIIGNLHAILRCVLMFVHVLLGIALIIVYRIRFGKQWFLHPAGLSIKRWWMLSATSKLGIRVAQYGQIDRRPLLFVANHVSFLDILVISAITDVRFLSKDTLRYWPFFGFMASMSGTLYIKRGKSSLIAQIINTLREALKVSHIVVFPEGTTSLGDGVKKFHAGLFQAAIDAQVPIQTIGIRYLHHGELDRMAAYIDKDNLLIKLWRLLERSYTDVHLIFNETTSTQDQIRQKLAQLAHNQIESQLTSNQYVALR